MCEEFVDNTTFDGYHNLKKGYKLSAQNWSPILKQLGKHSLASVHYFGLSKPTVSAVINPTLIAHTPQYIISPST